MVICLARGAYLHMAQPMPLPLTVSCFSKIQIGFTFLVPAHPGSPRQRAVKRVCVCVFCFLQILKTLKLLPIGNKTVLRDSRILSVVEKWSSETATPSAERSTEVSTSGVAETGDVAAGAEPADDVADDAEQAGSGTEAKEANDGSEETAQTEAMSRDDVGADRPEVSRSQFD